jgi:hypothetical protein
MELNFAADRLRDSLVGRLWPKEKAEIVEIAVLGDAALVVSIPPSPDVVGVENSGAFRFPVRTGSRTRWLTYEEVMVRASAAARAMYIKLLADRLECDPGGSLTYVSFASPVVVQAGDARPSLPIGSDPHARLRSLSRETITLEMRGAKGIFGWKRQPDWPRPVDHGPIEVPDGYSLTVPVDLIDSVWSEERLNSSRRLWSGAMMLGLLRSPPSRSYSALPYAP